MRTLAPPKSRNLGVFIVDSPSSIDFYDGRTPGQNLRTALDQVRVCAQVRTAVDLGGFEKALKTGCERYVDCFGASQRPVVPVIHFCNRPDPAGLRLTYDDLVTWADLGEMLRPLNKNLDGMLAVCTSSLFCAEAVAGAGAGGDLPYGSLVGPKNCHLWPEQVVAFTTYYHRLNRGDSPEEAVAAMNAATGKEFRQYVPGDGSKRFEPATWRHKPGR